MELPPQLLQGAEGPGRRPPQQPEGVPNAVQQTSQIGQHHQSCMFSLFVQHNFWTNCVLLMRFMYNMKYNYSPQMKPVYLI